MSLIERFVLWLKFRVYRRTVHNLIRRHLVGCAGVFHIGHYGLSGQYVVLMTDAEYHLWKNGRRPGLVNIYRDGDSFFMALPDFSNLQESSVIWLGQSVMERLVVENARELCDSETDNTIEVFFGALGLTARE